MSQQQTSTPVSPLRRRMLDDMAMRGLHEEAQRNYIMSVRNFAAFLGRSPETATAEDVRRFQVHQAESGLQPPTINNAVSGLRFLFNVTLDRPDLSRRLVLARYAQKLPTVLNVEEVGRLEGTVFGRCAPRHRHQEFIDFLDQIEDAVPAGKVTAAFLVSPAASFITGAIVMVDGGWTAQ